MSAALCDGKIYPLMLGENIMFIKIGKTKSLVKTFLSMFVIGCVFAGILCLGRLGYLGSWFGDCETALARATAPARAEASLKGLENYKDEVVKDARKYRLESLMLRHETEALEQSLQETREATDRLARTAKANGIPRPCDGVDLTEEQRSKEIVFNSNVVTGGDVYRILESWLKACEAKEKLIESKRALARRLDQVVSTLNEKQHEIDVKVDGLKNRVKELETARSEEKTKHCLAELEANVAGVNTGRIGGALETMEREIAELRAKTAILNDEALLKASTISPGDAADSASGYRAKIAALWDK